MTEVARFRIRPECIAAALADFRSAGVEPACVIERTDGEIAVEFDRLTYEQAAALAAAFRPEHSAVIGVIGGSPIESQ